MNINISTFKISIKQRYYIEQLHYFSILLLVLILPYWGAWKLIGPLAFIIFITSLFSGKIQIKEFLSNKVIIALFSFILLTYISFIWSPAETIFTQEFKWGIHRFQYYFLLIPGIYFSSLTKLRIKNIFFIMALAPIGTAVIYYLNAFGITAIYPVGLGGNNPIFTHYLVNNFFLAYSAIYFLHLSLNAFIKKEFKHFIVFFILLILFVSSMVIDPNMTSRLTLLAFLIVALITPLFYLKRKHSIILFVISVLFLAVFMNTNTSMKQGISTFKTAIEENKYSGSWGHRLGFIIVGIDIFKEHPIMGRGISDVREHVRVYAEENPKYFIGDKNRHFHNEHINLLVQVGIVGYLLYLLFIFLFLRIHISDFLISNIKYTYTIAFLVMQMGEHYFLFFNTTLLICLFFILIILYGERDKEELKALI